MIYLIDDTPVEMLHRYLKVEDFSDTLTRVEELDAAALATLRGCDCILIHSSFHDSQMKKKVFQIADYGDEIPLVSFSDGDLPEAEWDGDRFITAFKKSVMYSFLPVFLSSYRKTGSIDLKILAEGEHHLRKDAGTLATTILTPLMFIGEKAHVILNDVQKNALKELLELSQPEIQLTFADIQEEIGSMTVGDLRLQVSRIVDDFNKYGKNVHSWR